MTDTTSAARLLDVMERDILPMTERGVGLGNKVFGAAILRDPADHSLSGARRKAVTLRFAHSAARLLHALADPGAIREGAL